MGAVLILVLAWNNILIIQRYFQYNYKATADITKRLNELSQETPNNRVLVDFGEMRATRERLAAYDVEFQRLEEKDQTCRRQRLFIGNITEYCVVRD